MKDGFRVVCVRFFIRCLVFAVTYRNGAKMDMASQVNANGVDKGNLPRGLDAFHLPDRGLIERSLNGVNNKYLLNERVG